MASGTMRVGILIGAAINAGFRAAFGSARRASEDLTRSITRAGTTQARLGADIARGMANGANNIRQLHQQYQRLGQAITSANNAQTRLNRATASREAGANNRRELRGQMMETAAHGYAVGRPVWGSVNAYIEEEEAATNLKVALMRSDGTVGAFEALSRQAVKLGNILPGATTDFYNLARALKSQGISDDKLTGGAFMESAQLNIVMEMGQESGGEFFAKMIEAHGLTENDFTKAADLTQRAKFAFGMKQDDMYQSMKYYAPTAGVLNIKGSDNYEKLLAIQGMGAQKGLEGSSFGTNFAMMLGRMGKGPKMLKNSNKGMKAEAQTVLDKSKVDFQFYDKKGNFKGLEGMVIELEKLKKIQKEQGEEAALLVAGEMFGVEAARPALIIAEKGRAGLKENLKLMREQADLQQRIKEKVSTLGSALEELGGVARHAYATFGGAFKDDIQAFSATAQTFIQTTLQPWIENNKALIVNVIKVVGGLIAMKMATLAIAYTVSAALSPFKLLWVAGARVSALFARFNLFRLAGGFSRLGAIFKSVASGFMLVGRGILFIGRALLMNPIGLIITGIAVAAYLIYKYWKPISKFFKKLWGDVVGVFKRYGIDINNVVSNIWKKIKTAFDGGILGVGALILNWSPVGLFYKAWAKVLSWFGVDLPADFTGFGALIIKSMTDSISSTWELGKSIFNSIIEFIKHPFSSLAKVFEGFGGALIDGLIIGIKNKMESAKASITELGSNLKGWFSYELGIKSPSRVFMGYGDNITTGAAIGIEKAMPKTKNAIDKLNGQMQLGNNQNGLGLSGNFGNGVTGSGGDPLKGNITVNFNPVINANDVTGVKDALKLSLNDLETMLKKLDYQKSRRSFA